MDLFFLFFGIVNGAFWSWVFTSSWYTKKLRQSVMEFDRRCMEMRSFYTDLFNQFQVELHKARHKE